MTKQASATTSESSYRFAGRAAITSGVIGIAAFVLLIAALVGRASSGDERVWEILIRSHDVGLILQSIFLFPVVLALRDLGYDPSPGVSRATAYLGFAALSLVIFFLLLIFIRVWDVLYMIPQGLLGVWLIAISRHVSRVFSRHLKWLGAVSGASLLLVATFPIAYAIFVDPIGFHGPVPLDSAPPPSTANAIVHVILLIGTFMGVITYPIWATLVGRRLLRMRSC